MGLVLRSILIHPWRKMIVYLWLLLHIAAVADGKCAKNFYLDGLLEDCQPCFRRCNSPPPDCSTFCKRPSSSNNGARDNQNMRVILIVLFVFFGICTALNVILHVIRRKVCQHKRLAKAREQDSSESERISETTEQSEDMDGTAATNGEVDVEKGLNSTHCNSNLPLPSTEEGTTVLVTTKTYNCSTHYTQGVTLGLWRAGTV